MLVPIVADSCRTQSVKRLISTKYMKGISEIRHYQIGRQQVVVMWKNVRNVSLKVAPPDAEVRMSVPLGYSEAKVLELLESKRDWIDKAVSKVKKRAEATPTKHDPVMLRAWIEEFKPAFEKWEQRMGLRAAKVSFKMMSSRWGSCRASTRSLTFNLMLAYKPQECVEYVIIHELAHIVHPNHSPQFWDLVGRYCPDYRRLRRLLNNP
jgi:predicted metal-dependent hydrolase